ncbi:MAG: tRNA epoxyqueuosine(34) reductase QueG [Eubacteriaceae bacterium]|nr:tRNA epoxyqueuosine(34) reductase QueG [Eubacteriaceae bacterium]
MIDNYYLSQKALKHGIDIIGIVNRELLREFSEVVRNNVGNLKPAFFGGKMAQRLNAEKLLEENKGIISFGVSYASSLTAPDNKDSRVSIAKSAYGIDYHVVLKKYAESLMGEISATYPCRYEIHADTGIFLDRVAAYCAGIGFYGKNNFIINEKYGSYIFLGCILTDLPLDSSLSPHDQKCGDCADCLKACPGKAYSQGNLCHERCISYLTQKGKNPPFSRSIYGCDICQEVCPFNRDIPRNIHSEFAETAENAYPKAEDILKMGREGFEEKYGKSSMAWRGYDTIRANCEGVITAGRRKSEE